MDTLDQPIILVIFQEYFETINDVQNIQVSLFSIDHINTFHYIMYNWSQYWATSTWLVVSRAKIVIG